MDTFEEISKEFTKGITKKINHSIYVEVLKDINPKAHYKAKIKDNQEMIDSLQREVDEFTKIPKRDRNEPIDMHMRTFQEAIDMDKKEIQKLQKEINKYKDILKKL